MVSDLERRLNGQSKSRVYLRVLDKYGIEWDLEKAARDTWQNFFDGNEGTLDGVPIEINQEEGEYVLRIQGEARYDFRELLHFGGTTKTNNPFASGGMGEGADVLAFVLLRDYDFSRVRFGSGEWELDFVLNDVPEEEYPGERKGLFAYLRKANEKVNGNFIEFKTSNKEFAQVFKDSRDLFYHSNNQDFQNPTLDIPEVGGFKFLGKGSVEEGIPKGNFYYVRQRRHFKSEEWNTVEYVNLWTHKKFGLKKDRDRGVVTMEDISRVIIPQIVTAASTEDLTKVVYKLEPIWRASDPARPPLGDYYYLVGTSILKAIVDRLEREEIKLKFGEKYLANSSLLSADTNRALAAQGYVLCFQFMEDIGMKSAKDRFIEMQKHYRIQLTEGEKRRMELLYQAVRPIGRTAKEIWVYDREAEKSIFTGQYDEKFVWMCKERLHEPFIDALGTYLHELDHKHGTDQSAQFSYALTDTLKEAMKTIIRQHELYQRLEQYWNTSLSLDQTKLALDKISKKNRIF